MSSTKQNLAKYKLDLAFRIKGRGCPCHNNDWDILVESAKKKIPRLKKALEILAIISKKDGFSLENYEDLKKLEFDMMFNLLNHKLYLYPKHIFYPSYAGIITNYDCNFRCSHCYQTDFSKYCVKLNDVKIYLNKLKEVNISRIGIYGGECFLKPKLLQSIIKLIYQKKMVATITTNGFWCKDKKILKKNLEMLHSAGFDGTILISIGIGHQEFLKDLNVFIDIDDYSKEIFGKNIFHFSFEDISLKSFKKHKKTAEQLIKKFEVRFKRISPMGTGKTQKKNIIEEFKNNYESPDMLDCIAPVLLPGGHISYCPGPLMRDEKFIKAKINKNLSLKELFLKEDKQFVLWSKIRGHKIIQCLEKEGVLKKEDYPNFCLVCSKIKNNPELIDLLYDKLIKPNPYKI